MRVAPKVEMLEIASGMGHVNLTITWDENHLVLVDAGFPGQAEAIVQAITDAGFHAASLTDIIITHQDMDHIGCVLDLQRFAPSVRILAHEEEAPYLDGRATPIKLAAMLAQYDSLPADRKAWCDRMRDGYANRKLNVTETLRDKTILPLCGGIEVVHTPGHTPGHIALFLRESHIMVCGDAANIHDGQLTGPNPAHTYDMALGLQSFDKIKAFDMYGAVAYHGGYISMEPLQ